MEKVKRFELSEDDLDQVSGGKSSGNQKTTNTTQSSSKVWCPNCKAWVDVVKVGSGGRLVQCSKGHQFGEV